MTGGRLVVVDWTRTGARVGLFSRNVRGWQLTSELNLPPRLVAQSELPDGLVLLAGAEAVAVADDANTLVFEHPTVDLTNMEDLELASLLLDGFWRSVSDALVADGQLQAGEMIGGYVVTPQRFSLTLLERLRAAGAEHRPLKLLGSVQEAAALVIGALRAEVFHLEESAAQSTATVCLVAACDDQTIDIACFDYTLVTPTHHRILIRDCFQTTSGALSRRLHDCDWLGAFSLLAIVEDPSLPASVRTALDGPFQAIADSAAIQRQQSAVASRLRLLGGAHIAMCAARHGLDEQVYDLAHACHIGLQIDQQHFEPLVNKYVWTHLDELPYLAAQAFKLRGQPGNSLRLNLYSGYSTRVADAVPLANAMLWQDELAQLSGATALTAAVRLDAPGSGEFLLGVMPGNRILRRQTFALPGLMV